MNPNRRSHDRPCEETGAAAAWVAQATHLIAGKGFHDTTIRGVALRAGISPRQIDNDFPDKERLRLFVYDEIRVAHPEGIQAAPARVRVVVEPFAAGVASYCRVYGARPEPTRKGGAASDNSTADAGSVPTGTKTDSERGKSCL